MPIQVSTPHSKLLSHVFKEALEVETFETFFCLAPRTAPDLPIILSTRNSFIWSPYSPDGFQVPIIRSLTAPRSAGTCQAAVTGEDDQDFGKWCRHPLSQGHQNLSKKGTSLFNPRIHHMCQSCNMARFFGEAKFDLWSPVFTFQIFWFYEYI